VGSRAAGLGVGLVFGLVLAWSGMMSPDVIRGALLFEDSYLFLFFGSAVATASLGLWLLRRAGRVTWTPERPERRHVTGALIFGVGWGVSNACPGPIAAQLGQGIGWAAWTLTGVLLGVYLFLRRSEETEPACDPAPAPLARRRSVPGAA
jgi:uncharacterized membrane protein YedE/YeeE